MIATTIFTTKNIILLVFLVLEVFCSLLTLLAYRIDKTKAEKGKWRTKEKTLLLMAWVFGGIGGLAGVFLVRHKTKHWYFKVNNIIAFIVQIAVFATLVIML